MNFLKKTAAVLTSCTLLSSAAGICVHAAGESVKVSIEQVTLTLDELAAMNYCVPVTVTLTENPGVNAIELGVMVDERCTYEIVSEYGEDAPNGEMMITGMVADSDGSLSWLAWASASVMPRTGVLAYYNVTVPRNAAAGDVYTLEYLSEYYSLHQWNDNINEIYYGELGAVSWTDGYIKIAGGAASDKKGDVDCNGIVNVLDVITLNRNLLGGGSLEPQGIVNADVDGDGTPSAADSLQILKSIVGLAVLK